MIHVLLMVFTGASSDPDGEHHLVPRRLPGQQGAPCRQAAGQEESSEHPRTQRGLPTAEGTDAGQVSQDLSFWPTLRLD